MSLVARRALWCAFAALILALTGCGSAQPGAADGAGGPSAAQFPVTLKHAFGATRIDRTPQRIVTLSEDLDTLAALGITPVGYAPTAPGYTNNVPYLKSRIDLSKSKALDGADSGQFNLEQIAALRPDLILATNLAFIDKAKYDALTRIAPTLPYAVGWGKTPWQEVSATIGKAVGRESQARAAVAQTTRYLSGLKTQYPGLAGKTVASVYYFQSGTFATNPRSASMSKYLDLGMRVKPELLQAMPPDAKTNTISLERIDLLDADYLLVSVGSPGLAKELAANALYQKLKVVQRGHVHLVNPTDALPTYAGNSPTLLNIPWILDGQKATLAKVSQRQ